MTWDRWFAFIVVASVSAMTPGPAVFYVLSHGLAWGRRAALWAAMGILAANVLFFALSGLGLGAILLASHRLFIVLRWTGAAYLAYLGLRSFRAVGGVASPTGLSPVSCSGWTTMTRASALQLANPHALVFFAALLPQFLDGSKPVAPQLLLLTVTALSLELVILAVYGSFAARASRWAKTPRFAVAINRASGMLLLVAAGWLAVG